MSTNDTEPITPIDTLIVTRALHDAAQTIGSIVGAKTSHYGRWRVERLAGQYRAAADFLDVMHKASSPSILRRAADQIDPPTVPAGPDLTTPEGWIAEAKRVDDWTELPIPTTVAQYVALLAAAKEGAPTQLASDRLTVTLDHAARCPLAWTSIAEGS